MPATAFAEAAAILSQPNDTIVLGPSDDGGYYLIGMNQMHPEVFAGIDWSTERVLEQTQQRATEAGLTVHLLPTGFDVDNEATFLRLQNEIRSPHDSRAPATAEVLRTFIP